MAVAMDDEQAASFRAIVWCPASNYFLLNDTAPIDELKTKTDVLFGTDSTLTSGWNLWHHIRLARNTLLASDNELFDMLTSKPATIWGLKRSGKIEQGYTGDIVIAKKMYEDNFDSFFSVNPEDILLVIHRGKICLFDEELYDQLSTNSLADAFSKIQINQNKKYVFGEVPALLKEVLTYYPEASLPISV